MNSRWLICFLVVSAAFPAVAQVAGNPGMRLGDDDYERLPYEDALLKEKLLSLVSYEMFCPAIA